MRARMSVVVHPGKVLEVEVRIDLCGRYVAMTQQLLNAAQVAGGFQHVGGVGMAQHMRMQAVIAELNRGNFFQAILYRARRNTVAAATGKEPATGVCAQVLHPLTQCCHAQTAQGYAPFLTALTQHLNHALGQIHIGQSQVRKLTQPQTAAVEEFEQHFIAQRLGVIGADVQKLRRLIRIQHLGQAPLDLRPGVNRGGIRCYLALAEQKMVETANRRETARNAAIAQALPLEVNGKSRDVLGIGACWVVANKSDKSLNIMAIGHQGARRIVTLLLKG